MQKKEPKTLEQIEDKLVELTNKFDSINKDLSSYVSLKKENPFDTSEPPSCDDVSDLYEIVDTVRMYLRKHHNTNKGRGQYLHEEFAGLLDEITGLSVHVEAEELKHMETM